MDAPSSYMPSGNVNFMSFDDEASSFDPSSYAKVMLEHTRRQLKNATEESNRRRTSVDSGMKPASLSSQSSGDSVESPDL